VFLVPTCTTSLIGLIALLSILPACAVGKLPVASSSSSPQSSAPPVNHQPVLQESWIAYRDRFIQPDGRVIDWESDQRTTSEGQAYGLLRSVLADDPKSFQQVLNWSEANLARKGPDSKLTDRLWTWKWGRIPSGKSAGKWGVVDGNFASDADIDACYALILAAQRWQRPEYRTLAAEKLRDLWDRSTIVIQGKRYLLPGPDAAFRRDDVVTFNPSYLAPYAFRLFAEVDKDRSWLTLVDSSYELLEQSAKVSTVGLPSDWIGLDIKTGKYVALTAPLLSQYSFDASRVWWRVALDAEIFREPRAQAYLRNQLPHIQKLWSQKQPIPAQIDLQGNGLVNYESTAQYGMLYVALRQIDPKLAEEIYQQKILPRYQAGFWDSNNAYYTQNLVWFGLLSPQSIEQAWKGQFKLSADPGLSTTK
jgi:endoglucanase